MCADPQWLPDMAAVDPWQHGGQGDTYAMLYGIFQRDLVQSQLRYDGHEVWHFPEMEDGKVKLFWHLTSRDQVIKHVPRHKQKYAAAIQQPERLPDLRRSERLPWVRPIIENTTDPEVAAWDYLEGDGNTKTYVWLKDYDFVVIMKRYPDGRRRLITSFYVDSAYKQKDLERKHANRVV